MRPDNNKTFEETYLGNVLSSSFEDIWFSEVADEIRMDIINGKLHKKCQCPGCPFYSAKPPYTMKRINYGEYPLFLELDLPNTHCNVGGLNPGPSSPACIMCERSDPKFTPEEDHLFDVIDKIKYLMPNLQQIHIQGIAEPFYETSQVDYMLFDIMDALDFDKYAWQITLSITTNATLFKKQVREEYLKRAPKSITIFSLDASTPETYKKIRIFDCFDKVLENIYSFSAERSRDRQFIKIHNNINTLNVDEVIGMVEIANKAKVECVEFNPTLGFNTEILLNHENCGVFAKAQKDIIDHCNKLGVHYNFIRPLDLGMADYLIQITL